VFTPFNEAVIVVVPELTLLARPWGLITATLTFEEIHAACDETSRVVPSLKDPLAMKYREPPRAMLAEFGVMASPVSVAFVT
jgi:hypothetical protein